ncbi:MAG: SDR family oxidoreductase [Blastocatellia bacterium]|nr:SDR family oxidoreductase [Blastocatellia bacterium]
MSKRFEGKVALITGATSGIGRTTAIEFAKEGAKVVVSGRREAEGLETVEQIKAVGGDAIFVKADVAKEEDVKNLVEETVKHYGKLNIAFNNAGFEGLVAPITEQTVENYNAVMDANLKSLFFSLKYEIPEIIKQGGGAITNNSSIAGLIGMAGVSIYVAAKHAVLGITKAAALEVAKSGIRINAVSPAAIQTDMFERFTDRDSEKKSYMEALHPIGRVGRPEEIASAVLFLSSDESSFITGHSLNIDGGFTAQ